MLNLYPWNLWILWASIILLVVFLIILATHAVPLLKTIKQISKQVSGLQERQKALQIRKEVLQEKGAQVKKSAKPALVLLPMLYALHQQRKKHPEQDMKEAMNQVMMDKIRKQDLRDLLASLH
ncbi:MAG: hypothetical protein SOI44_02955 [Lactimicrobium sp.]|jgi:CRISPR/Cas system CSM-associated protein Csm2 small subunit|uniref:hypothetical protein n=1 Tax=Lactimicrobium sp. TaxID=2563780 RepID=UPI002F3568DE